MIRIEDEVTLGDMYAGGGGSFLGASWLKDLHLKWGGNHAVEAMKVHRANFPKSKHFCVNVHEVDPEFFPYTTVLWISPECPYNSRAQGKVRGWEDPLAIRSRASMGDVVKMAKTMLSINRPYMGFIVENVPEVRFWKDFNRWLRKMDNLGYRHQIVYINSMVSWGSGGLIPPAESRNRIYIIFSWKGNPVPDYEIRPPCLCPIEEKIVEGAQHWKKTKLLLQLGYEWGGYPDQYIYKCPTCSTPNKTVEVFPIVRPAITAIDWSIPSQRIGDREVPYKPNTQRRIKAGIELFGPRLNSEEVEADYPGQSAVSPFLVPVEGRDGRNPRSVFAVGYTQTTRRETALVLPPGGEFSLINYPPFIAELRGTATVRPATEPFATFTAGGYNHMLVNQHMGFMTQKNSNNVFASAGKQNPWKSIIVSYYRTSRARSLLETLPTIPTVDRHMLVDIDELYVDCLARMLGVREIQSARGFPPNYNLLEYSGRTKVRLLGNAVTPQIATILLQRLIASFTGEYFEIQAPFFALAA